MIRLITVITIVTGLIGCNSDRIFESDVERLIDTKKKSTEEILGQLKKFIHQHGKGGFEFQNGIVNDFSKTHRCISPLIVCTKI